MLRYCYISIFSFWFFAGCSDHVPSSHASRNSSQPQTPSVSSQPVPTSARAILKDAKALAAEYKSHIDRQVSLRNELVKKSESFATNSATAEVLLITEYNGSYYLNIIANYLSDFLKNSHNFIGGISSELFKNIERLLILLPKNRANEVVNKKVAGQSFFSSLLGATYFNEMALMLLDNYNIAYDSLDNEKLDYLFHMLENSPKGSHKKMIALIDNELKKNNIINNFVRYVAAQSSFGHFDSLYRNVDDLRKKEFRKLLLKEKLALAKAAALASAVDGSQVKNLAQVKDLRKFNSPPFLISDPVSNNQGHDVNLFTYGIDLLKGPEFKDPRIKALVTEFTAAARGIMTKSQWQTLATDALVITSGPEGLNDSKEARLLLRWDEEGIIGNISI